MSKTINFAVYDENDEEIVHDIPAVWKICGNCDGDGKHMNESMRSHAYSTEEFFEEFPSPEECAQYFNGSYDVYCNDCKGTGKILEADWEYLNHKNNKELRKAYTDYLSDNSYYDAERITEMKFGL